MKLNPKLIEDTRWITINDLRNNFVSYNSSSIPQIRRIGKIVQLRGALKPGTQISANQSTTMFVISSDFIPSKDQIFVCQGSDVNRWVLKVLTNGSVGIERYGASSNIAIPSGTWLPFDVVYFVD